MKIEREKETEKTTMQYRRKTTLKISRATRNDDILYFDFLWNLGYAVEFIPFFSFCCRHLLCSCVKHTFQRIERLHSFKTWLLNSCNRKGCCLNSS